jgi:hypothetical protein
MMRPGRRGDRDGVNPRIFQGVLDRGVDGDLRIEACEFRAPRRIVIDDAGDTPLLRRVKVANQVWAPVAGAHDGCHEFLRHGAV